jgi:undecaprenyl-diphosphatase
VLLTGFDRVALGVHYVSDVVAGWIVALACLAGTAGAFEVWRREHGRPASTPSEGVDPDAADEIADPPKDKPARPDRPIRSSRDDAQFESRSRP